VGWFDEGHSHFCLPGHSLEVDGFDWLRRKGVRLFEAFAQGCQWSLGFGHLFGASSSSCLSSSRFSSWASSKVDRTLALSVHSSLLSFLNKSMECNCIKGWFHAAVSLFREFDQLVLVVCCICWSYAKNGCRLSYSGSACTDAWLLLQTIVVGFSNE